jgi:hypothetical protein
LLIDVAAPIAAYFVLRAFGVGDLPALLAGGSVAAASAVLSLTLQRRARPLPIFVCTTFAATGALAILTGDPRIPLLKGSIGATAIALACFFLATRPRLLGRLLTPGVARGSDARAARWSAAWASDADLRRRLRLAAALAGLAILAEAAARAAIVYRFTIGQALFLAHAPAIVLVVVLVGMMLRLVAPAVARAMAAQEGEPSAR